MKFTLKATPALRIDLRAVTPSAAATVADLERLLVPFGRETVALGELFKIDVSDSDGWRFEGDLSRFDRIGWQMAAGRIVVDGPVGDYVGAGMSGGEIVVNGDARDLAACEMSGGRLVVEGSVGDFAAGALPGSMDGMRGGTLIVKRDAGQRFADRMRRGSALVFGNAGDFLASRLVAGTIAIGGTAGAHVGYGMRRGSVIFAGPAPAISRTFMPALVEAAVFWQLIARDLGVHGGPFAGLASRRIQRHLGDVSAAGKGELIVVS